VHLVIIVSIDRLIFLSTTFINLLNWTLPIGSVLSVSHSYERFSGLRLLLPLGLSKQFLRARCLLIILLMSPGEMYVTKTQKDQKVSRPVLWQSL
jgi:hypothetical protein